MIHVEAGLRSRDDDMPEEINRKLTDAISDLLFVSDPAGMENLEREGVAGERALLRRQRHDRHAARRARAGDALADPRASSACRARGYVLVTLHRPRNVDDPAQLGALLRDDRRDRRAICRSSSRSTRARARASPAPGCTLDPARWRLIEPLGYLDFLKLTAQARIVLTDSGGIQEETTVLGVPCITCARTPSARSRSPKAPTSSPAPSSASVREHVGKALAAQTAGRVPRFWDGKSADRIADILLDVFAE